MRFNENQHFYYEDYYKCFHPDYYIVRGEHLETLKHFENLSFKDLFTEERIKKFHYGNKYLNSKLVKIEEKRVCILAELGQTFLYLLASKLTKGIEQFLELLNTMYKEEKGLVRIAEEGRIMKMYFVSFERMSSRFEQIENFNFILHLLGKTNSGFIMQDWNKNIEFHIKKIEGLLENLKLYDFSKVTLLDDE